MLLGALASAAGVVHGACPEPPVGAQIVVQGPVQAAWTAQPWPIVVGEPFALRVTLCPAAARLIRVDATMPEHRHGMNYRARLTPLGGARWRVDGLLWHMSGRWELRLDVKSQGKEHRLLQSVQLP